MFLAPPIKWAGGKRWLTSILKEIYQGQRLVEPFCGSLSVALALQPGEAILNDINYPLINFHKHLQQGLKINIPLINSKDMYYSHRSKFNELLQTNREHQTIAELFYYLNRTGYNGLCRFNKKGEYNVPYGSYKNINYIKDFSIYQPVLSSWQFTCMDFQEIQINPGDFIYADPPYDTQFTQYSPDGYTWDDQIRLAMWLAGHALNGCSVVASNQATDRIIELYKGLMFKIELLDAPRRISCNGNRAPAKEILATKNINY